MSHFSRRNNSALRFLHKKGRSKEVEELERVDRMLQAAIENGEITHQQFGSHTLPAHYDKLAFRHAQLQQILNTEFDGHVKKAKGEGKEKEFLGYVEKFEAEVPEDSEDPEERQARIETQNARYDSAKEKYMTNPTKENKIAFVKETVWGDKTVDERHLETDRRSAETTRKMIEAVDKRNIEKAALAQIQQKRDAQAVARINSREELARQVALDDKRMRPVSTTDPRAEAFQARVDAEIAKASE